MFARLRGRRKGPWLSVRKPSLRHSKGKRVACPLQRSARPWLKPRLNEVTAYAQIRASPSACPLFGVLASETPETTAHGKLRERDSPSPSLHCRRTASLPSRELSGSRPSPIYLSVDNSADNSSTNKATGGSNTNSQTNDQTNSNRANGGNATGGTGNGGYGYGGAGGRGGAGGYGYG